MTHATPFNSDADRAARFHDMALECVRASKRAEPAEVLRQICKLSGPFKPSAESLGATLHAANKELGGKVSEEHIATLARVHAAKNDDARLRIAQALSENKRYKRLKRLAATNPTVAALENFHAKRVGRGRRIPLIETIQK